MKLDLNPRIMRGRSNNELIVYTMFCGQHPILAVYKQTDKQGILRARIMFIIIEFERFLFEHLLRGTT